MRVWCSVALRFRTAAVLVLLGSLGACTPRVDPDLPTADGMASLGEPFRLGVGATRLVAGEDLRLWLISVSNDSRCPSGVQCVSAGDAIVRLNVSRAFEDLASIELRVAGAATATYQDYTIRLAELAPPPAPAGESIPPDAYVATLEVTKGN
jgi:hypothetical protein